LEFLELRTYQLIRTLPMGDALALPLKLLFYIPRIGGSYFLNFLFNSINNL